MPVCIAYWKSSSIAEYIFARLGWIFDENEPMAIGDEKAGAISDEP